MNHGHCRKNIKAQRSQTSLVDSDTFNIYGFYFQTGLRLVFVLILDRIDLGPDIEANKELQFSNKFV